MSKCNVCNCVYDEESLLQNSQDEYFCKNCFKRLYASSAWKGNLENRCRGDVLVKPKKMFPLSDLNSLRQERQKKKMTPCTSKKPLQCPHDDCKKHVSVFDLHTHFRHEHGDIPIIHSVLESRHPTAFYSKNSIYGSTRCLMLLNITKPNISTSIRPTWYKPEPKVSIVVLTSRIGVSQLIDENCGASNDDNNSLAFSSNDKIIMWIASNVPTDFSYTIAASSVAEDARIKYYGPVLQLGDSPSKLCLEGNCLMMNHFHFMKMTEGGATALNLDIIVHGAE